MEALMEMQMFYKIHLTIPGDIAWLIKQKNILSFKQRNPNKLKKYEFKRMKESNNKRCL